MRLATVAKAFDNTPCVDAYTGDYLFSGQFMLFDDTKRDSETSERRILSVAPTVTLPARRTVASMGTRWLIGHANPDAYRGEVIRVGHIAHEATFLSQVRTLNEVCTGDDGFSAWAGRAWIKNLAYSEQSSKLTQEQHIHFAADEPVREGALVTFEGRLNLVRSVVYAPGGTLVALVDELSEPSVEVATVSTGVYDPVTDALTAGTDSVRVIRVRWQSLFQYRNNHAPKFGPEDIQVVISKDDMVPYTGAVLTLSDGTWKINAVHDEGDVWLCRAVQHE